MQAKQTLLMILESHKHLLMMSSSLDPLNVALKSEIESVISFLQSEILAIESLMSLASSIPKEQRRSARLAKKTN